MSPCSVVTGAAGALGSAVVRSLVAAGHAVAAVGSPASQARLEALARELAARGRCVAIAIDVASPQAWSEALPRIERELGPPAGAVLTAGGWAGGKPFIEDGEDTLRAMLAANLETASQSMRALLPGMVARGDGSVVVIGSRAAIEPKTSANAAAYAASKAALLALAQAVAAEVHERGVRINAVLPSTIDTPANRQAMPNADPMRWVNADRLARVAAFLLSDDARDI
jgi:NAD(P)-dependent dehydrogenase (short-subunit alcohol dehydrogenase family)